jgi:8-oxo-dGTP diphosphatase
VARSPIGIAVVEYKGKFLVGMRGPEGPLAGCAEFPGGKCRHGESPADCARRECLEETGLDVEPLELLLEIAYDYPHGAVQLDFWHCKVANPENVATDHNGFRWVPLNELSHLTFPEANKPVIALLSD